MISFSKNGLFLNEKSSETLLFLVAIRASSFLTLVRRYLMSFSFFTTWHMLVFFNIPPKAGRVITLLQH
jgi:hypothetical protein